MIRPGSITPLSVELQRQLSPASSRSPILICVQDSSYSWSSKNRTECIKVLLSLKHSSRLEEYPADDF